jgi:hypothetical protein
MDEKIEKLRDEIGQKLDSLISDGKKEEFTNNEEILDKELHRLHIFLKSGEAKSSAKTDWTIGRIEKIQNILLVGLS